MSNAREAAWRAAAESGSDTGDPKVVAAVQEYLAALETGECPSRQEFLERHADISQELGHCLDGLEFIHQAARDLRHEADILGTPFTVDPQPRPLGDFRLVREIGRGGMGIVYEAVQLSLGRRVALKVLPFVAALEPTRLQRFKNEAQAAAQLHHTNIVPVHAVGVERGVHFYAMQLIEGQSLADLIGDLRHLQSGPAAADTRAAGRAPLPAAPIDQGETVAPELTVLTLDHRHPARYFRSVGQLMEQAVAAVGHAHQFGVVHRDIKPANLLLDERGKIWVTDFGLAQFHSDAQLTQTGETLGTPRYMSPEQAAGGRAMVDHRTDIYSLGITLYELLTLEPAFASDDRHVVLRQIIEVEPAPPRSLNRHISPELETIVLKAIAKAPAERYATAEQMADDLRRWLDDKPILARRPTLLEHAARWRRRHQALVNSAVAVLFLAVLGLLGGTIAIMREHAETKAAYEREIKQRKTADESFQQARRAVDAFAALVEEEFADKPSMYPERRRFLQTALEYYENFLDQRNNDPTVQAELLATSERVARIVDELTVLEGFAPLMLLSDGRVEQELAMTPQQRDEIDELVARRRSDRERARAGDRQLTQALRQQQLVDILRSSAEQAAAILSPEQTRRLRQIAWQQQGPFAFKDSVVVASLGLTREQRKQINETIENNGPHRRLPRPADRRPQGRPPDGEQRADSAPGRELDGPKFTPRSTHGPPPGGPREFPAPPARGGPGDMRAIMDRTVEEILTILTPRQRATWKQLSGERFDHDLGYRPDDWIPQ